MLQPEVRDLTHSSPTALTSDSASAIGARAEHLIPFALTIKPSDSRDRMSILKGEAFNALYVNWGRTSPIIRQAYDEIARVGGIRILEQRDFSADYSFRCFEYVFQKLLPKLNITRETHSEFWQDPVGFIERHNFEATSQQDGAELVLYGDVFEECGRKGFYVHHIGICKGTLVWSKFDEGDVFEHPLEQVPGDYGDSVVFFRRKAIQQT